MARPKKLLLQCQDIIMQALLEYEKARQIQDNPKDELFNHKYCFKNQKTLANFCAKNLKCSERTAVDAITDLQCGTNYERRELKLNDYDIEKYHHKPYISKDNKTHIYHPTKDAYGNYIFGEDNMTGTPKQMPNSDVFPDITQKSITHLPYDEIEIFNVPKYDAQNISEAINTHFSYKDIQAYMIAPNLLLCIQIALDFPAHSLDDLDNNSVPDDVPRSRSCSLYERLYDFFEINNYVVNNIYNNISKIDGYNKRQLEDKIEENLLLQEQQAKKDAVRNGSLNLRKRKPISKTQK